MRIAMTAACPFPSARGSQVLIGSLVRDLRELGHEVHLVTYPAVTAGGRVESRRFDPIPSLRDVWERICKDVGLGVRLYRAVRDHRIEVIHAHNYEAPICAYVTRWLTGVPVVYHSHNALSDELATYVPGALAKAVARRLGRVLDRQVPRRADFTIALTGDLEKYLLSCGVAAARMAVYPPSADSWSGETVPATAPGDTLFVIGYAGNLDPYQDLDVLFRGFAHFRSKVQNARLLIVTHEQDWRRRAGWLLEDLVGRGFARVIVSPTYSGVAPELRRADVLACPRSSWSGYPIKLLNYMSAGRPILAARGSAKGIADGETGLVFADGDALHLAQQLARLHADPDLRRRLGEAAASAICENHNPKEIASEIAKIHARLGNCRTSRPLRGGAQWARLRVRMKARLGRRTGAVSSVKTSR